jgi:transmembrane sensor
MEEPLRPFAELGARVARTQDRALARLATARTKERLLATPPGPAAVRRWWLALLPAAVLVGVVAFVVRSRVAADAAGFELSDGTPAVVGQWIGAPATSSVTMRFHDGTAVVLAPGSSARVAEVGAAGARIVVERGTIDAAVAPAAGARWHFDVGPFSVLVTGTRFRATWDPTTTELSFELTEGSVVLSGPVVGEGRLVVAGETVAVSVAEARMQLRSVGVPAAAPDDTVAAAGGAAASDVTSSAAALDGTASSEKHDVPPSVAGGRPVADRAAGGAEPPAVWLMLARSGRYREALGRAREDGLDAISQRAAADDLAVLADAARLAGDGAEAARLLGELRRRFPGGLQAAAAAFTLGRLAFDVDAQHAVAAEWFATYLRERPDGPFAREALGRLVEARTLAGDTEGARAAARSYLEAYPSGPHADAARTALGP